MALMARQFVRLPVPTKSARAYPLEFPVPCWIDGR